MSFSVWACIIISVTSLSASRLRAKVQVKVNYGTCYAKCLTPCESGYGGSSLTHHYHHFITSYKTRFLLRRPLFPPHSTHIHLQQPQFKSSIYDKMETDSHKHQKLYQSTDDDCCFSENESDAPEPFRLLDL